VITPDNQGKVRKAEVAVADKVVKVDEADAEETVDEADLSALPHPTRSSKETPKA